jgi:hypothetical protein
MATVNEGTPFKFKVVGLRQDGTEGPVPTGLVCALSDAALGSVAFQADGSQGAVVFVAEGACKLTADAGGFHDEIDLTFVKAPVVESPVVGIKIVETP